MIRNLLPFSPLRFQGGKPKKSTPSDLGKPVPRDLRRLFKAVPKTELHLHLAGSTPLDKIKRFMVENGLKKRQIQKDLKLVKPQYDSLNDILKTYYTVPKHVYTASQFKRAAKAVVQDAARENVRVLEIRTSVLHKGGKPEELVEATEAGMREGISWVKEHLGYEMKSSLIILAQRAGSPEDSLAHAKLAVKMAKRPGSMVRGFDLAGSETDHSVTHHTKALQYIKRYGKPLGMGLTVHAGETGQSENMTGVQSMKWALQYGADRLGHGLQAIQDEKLLAKLKKNNTPLELSPWSNVQIQAVPSYDQHPIRPFLDHGLNVNLNTDNRMVSRITLSKQLAQLWSHKLVKTWNELKTLTLNGVRAAFLPELEKKQVERDVTAQFDELESQYKHTIDQYLAEPQKSEKAS